jgi:eukaryotic-like serine/threonine-protein kinase
VTQTTWNDGLPSGRAAPGITIGGRYALRAAVGNGGMGTVWRASDTLLRREVAVKEVVLPPGLAPSDRDAMYERTMREARAAAALSHPAVVQVYDVVTEAGRPWIVMELLDARSLADMVIEDGPVAPRAVAKIGIALLGALEVAHAAGVLHRDVKPANVLICADGRCVLTDFGVARMPTDVQLTTPGMVLGSPHFISPERAMGGPFGPPSDLFSLGVTLYTAVEGRPPFDKGDPIETMHAVVEDPPTPPVRAGALATVLSGLLEKDPARRWNVPAARAALRDLLAGPLASSSPQFITDPYAVVPAQRPGGPAPAVPAQPSGQIGGRAMLAPGESLADRLGHRPPDAGPGHQPAADATTAGFGGPPPTAPPTAGFGGPTVPGVPGSPVFPGSPGAPPPPPPGWAPQNQAPYGGFPAPPTAGWPGRPHAGPHVAQPTVGVLSPARRAGSSLVERVKTWPQRTKLLATGGIAVLVVAASLAAMNLGGASGGPPAGASATQESPTPVPAIPVVQHAARGISVSVPQGWKQTSAGSWIDFTDPDDARRKVRLIVEDAGSDPVKFMQVAENGLKSRTTSCAKPYAQVELREDVQLAGQAAAELEYTCGQGDQKRHGIWRAVLQDGKAYSFFLTAREGRFAESRPIFDEMVRTFKLDPA